MAESRENPEGNHDRSVYNSVSLQLCLWVSFNKVKLRFCSNLLVRCGVWFHTPNLTRQRSKNILKPNLTLFKLTHKTLVSAYEVRGLYQCQLACFLYNVAIYNLLVTLKLLALHWHSHEVFPKAHLIKYNSLKFPFTHASWYIGKWFTDGS